jgi:hypothetical protein
VLLIARTVGVAPADAPEIVIDIIEAFEKRGFTIL